MRATAAPFPFPRPLLARLLLALGILAATGQAVLAQWQSGAPRATPSHGAEVPDPARVAVLSADWLLARAAQSCAAYSPEPPAIAPGFLQDADIDGDGASDYLVDWSKVLCGGGFGRAALQGAGSCAALGCALDVWVSSLGTAQPAASTQGFQLVPVTTDGRTELYVIGNGLPCAAPAEEFACATRWGWTGGALQPTGEPVTLAAFRRLTG